MIYNSYGNDIGSQRRQTFGFWLLATALGTVAYVFLRTPARR